MEPEQLVDPKLRNCDIADRLVALIKERERVGYDGNKFLRRAVETIRAMDTDLLLVYGQSNNTLPSELSIPNAAARAWVERAIEGEDVAYEFHAGFTLRAITSRRSYGREELQEGDNL